MATTRRGPGAAAARKADARVRDASFDADQRRTERETAPVTIEGVTLTRRRKVWKISRAMRRLLQAQQKLNAKSVRLQGRIAELAAEQAEAAIDGETEKEEALETKIDALVEAQDEAHEQAEVEAYRIIALLLVAPETGTDDIDAETLASFGGMVDGEFDPENLDPAVEWLQESIDVEDAAALVETLTSSTEADPQTTQESATTSS